MPGQYNAPLEDEAANNIRYGRIPQRVSRRYKTLKRVECVYYSTCLRMRQAHPFRSHALVANDVDHHFLPTVFTPGLAVRALTQISSVHDAMHRPRK